MTGCPLPCAWPEACRFGELSQQSVAPHVWQVRRCTQYAPIFTHSSHSRRCGCLIDAVALMWAQEGIHVILAPRDEQRTEIAECRSSCETRHVSLLRTLTCYAVNRT